MDRRYELDGVRRSLMMLSPGVAALGREEAIGLVEEVMWRERLDRLIAGLRHLLNQAAPCAADVRPVWCMKGRLPDRRPFRHRQRAETTVVRRVRADQAVVPAIAVAMAGTGPYAELGIRATMPRRRLCRVGWW